MAATKYQKPPQAPPLFTATPKSIAADTKRLTDRSRDLMDGIVKNVTPGTATFDKVLLPLARDDNVIHQEGNVIAFYQHVSSDEKVRNASTEAEKSMQEHDIEACMREDIFQLVEAIGKKNEPLDKESKRLLEKNYKRYIRMGLGVPAGPKRDRFKAIKKRLSELAISFQRNINEENSGLWVTPEQLDGMPRDVVSGLRKGEGENEGKVRLTFKNPDVLPAFDYVKDAEVRKTIFMANENKCNTNVPLFKEAIVLRDEAARILGYPDHASFRIEDKMAKTTDTVHNFLNDLRTKLVPGGIEEIKKLKELKAKDLANRGQESQNDGNYYIWDNRFYNNLMLNQEYQLDQEAIAEYFPLETTIRGMLQIFEDLFGLAFVELKGKDRDALSETGNGRDIVWHDDVQLFSVWDDEGEGSGFVGYLYLDLHPRDGKYSHAANINLQPGSITKNGTRRYPATALVCNFPRPTLEKPSLLSLRQIVTLFHELGYGIHDLVSRITYSRFHGTEVVGDFVEAPSKMLENWCWTPSLLRALSKHYSYLSSAYKEAWKKHSPTSERPSEALPEALVNSIIRTRHVNDAVYNLGQLHLAIYDITVHRGESTKQIGEISTAGLYNQIRSELTKLNGPEVLGQAYDWGNRQAIFGHLMGGYDAGYYGYLYSQVFSADMFYTVFKADPMNGKEGRRYRHQVLEKGGSQDEMETLKRFLGREPNPKAFFAELGLDRSGLKP